TNSIIPRKYFCGGAVGFRQTDLLEKPASDKANLSAPESKTNNIKVDFKLEAVFPDTAMLNDPDQEEQKPSAIRELFKSSRKASLTIASKEKELGEIKEPSIYLGQEGMINLFTPDPLKGKIEAKLIWNFIRNPSTDPQEIKKRQELIQALRDFNGMDKLVNLKNKAYLASSSIEKLYEGFPIDNNRYETAIRVYRTRLNQFPLVEKSVWSALSSLEEGKRALDDLISELETINKNPLKSIIAELKEYQKQFAIYDNQYFLTGPKYEEYDARDTAKSFLNAFELFGAFLEFANIAKQDNYARATFNPQEKAEYKKGWLFTRGKKGKEAQALNDSPADNPMTIICGANMGGKSFNLMQNFYMQLLAQSFGFVPAKEGNFRIFNSFFYIDRASTESYFDLSAYGSDVKNWIKALREAGENTFIISDEGFSTTAADDQYAMLIGASEYLMKRGGKIIISSHNEAFVNHYKDEDDIGIYHFPLKEDSQGNLIFDKNGFPVYTYTLTPGAGDSRALEVALSLGLPKELIEAARNFLSGKLERAEPPSQRNWPKPETYSEKERARMKQGRALPDLFPRPKKRSPWELIEKEDDSSGLFRRFSEDRDFTRDFLPAIVTEEKPISLGILNINSSSERQKLLFSLLTKSSRLSVKEIMERQRMFEALSKNDRYRDLVTIGDRLLFILYFLPRLLSATDRPDILKFNTALFPEQFFDEDYGNNLEAALAFLALNKKVLGNDFPPQLESKILKAQKALALYKALAEYEDTQDIFSIQTLRDQEYDEEITNTDIIAEYEKLTSDEPNKTKWQGKLTRRRVKEFFSWLKTHDRKRYDRIRLSTRGDSPLGDLYFKIRANYPALNIQPTEEREDGTEEPEFSAEAIKKQYLKLADKEPPELKAKWGDKICYRRIKECAELLEKEDRELLIFGDTNAQKLRNLAANIRYGQRGLDIKDDFIRKSFSEIEESPAQAKTRINHDVILHIIYYVQEELRLAPLSLPGRSIFETDLKLLQPEIKAIAAYHKKAASRENQPVGLDDTWPTKLLLVLFLEMFSENTDLFGDFISLLREYDSVHLSQIANNMESLSSTLTSAVPARHTIRSGILMLEPDLSDITYAREYFNQQKERLTLLFSSEEIDAIEKSLGQGNSSILIESITRLESIAGYRKIEKVAGSVYNKTISGIIEEYRGIDNAFHKIFAEHPLLKSVSNVEYCRIILSSENSNDRQQIGQAINAYRWLTGLTNTNTILFPYSDSQQNPEKRATELENFRKFYRENIIETGLKDEITAIIEAVDSIYPRAESLIRDNYNHFRSFDTGSLLNSLYNGDAGPLEQALAKIFHKGLYNTWGGLSRKKEQAQEIQNIILQAQALGLMGHAIRNLSFAKAVYNEDGTVDFKELFSLFELKEKQHSNSQHFGSDEFVRALAAPNMSGKTFFLKALIMAMLSGMNTGFVPAKSATMPYFDAIVYFDRVVSKLDRNLSALGEEVEQWKTFFEILSSGINVFICACIDEAFSTTSPKYQASLLFGVIQEIIKKGQYMAIASHNHDVLKTLQGLENNFMRTFTLDFEKKEDGKIKFNYSIREMGKDEESSSYAVEVARTLGMPEEVLTAAERVLSSLHPEDKTAAQNQIQADPAQLSKNVGGIDFNPKLLEIDDGNLGHWISQAKPMELPQNISGFRPVIIDIN
ncbi:MAG: hypothetical protein HQL27_07945, partial [Candidatus Omnitrophica bacterium]|nr:hypothetical protein [Candidatus Omnitrophota bacterium]